MTFPIHHIEEYYSRRQAQSNQEYRDEIKELRKIIWCLLESSKGEIRVFDKTLKMYMDPPNIIQTYQDERNRCTVFSSH